MAINVIVKIWCLPVLRDPLYQEKQLLELHNMIVATTMGIPEFGVQSEKDMLNLFPADMMKYGLGKEILIEVTPFGSLIPHREQWNDARNKLIRGLAERVGLMIHSAEEVLCLIHPQEQEGILRYTYRPERPKKE